MARRYWLMKSEPGTFSFDDLKNSPGQRTSWEGVRNYQARNLMRDEMNKGDGVLFYHSNANPPTLVGTAQVVREAYPDDAQFDKKSAYYDPKASKKEPRWFMVDIQYDRPFRRPLPLPELRQRASLKNMVLLTKSRLSVQPVTASQWKTLLTMGGLKVR